MFGLGLPEIAIIALVIAVFFFGGEKISELARGLGRFSGEFRKGRKEVEGEVSKIKEEFESVKIRKPEITPEPEKESPKKPPDKSAGKKAKNTERR